MAPPSEIEVKFSKLLFSIKQWSMFCKYKLPPYRACEFSIIFLTKFKTFKYWANMDPAAIDELEIEKLQFWIEVEFPYI